MTAAFMEYFDAIKALDLKDATEHTLRPTLENLLKSLVKPSKPAIRIIHEPKRDKGGKGAPDFKFKVNESILGYLENKKIEENLDQILKSDQIKKYKSLSDNLVLTNYLEWVWLREGQIIQRETLCYASDVGNRKARLDPDKAEKVANLLSGFLSTPPKGIGKAKNLALALATRCHDLREYLTEELIRQEREHQQGRLFGLYAIFKKDVFHELTLAEFADAFAQMLGYGLFLARLNSGTNDAISLHNAKRHIPVNFVLIRELVNFLDELENPDYASIKWLVEEILSIMNNLNIAAIHEDLSFTKRQGKLFDATEEERLLFAKDPYVYFYEDFLKAYDAAMRKRRGVYYTPPPVVNFIVRAINGILKDVFLIPAGLAERRKVTVLDFATGTGTFLLEILHQIFDVVSEGVRDQMIREHVLKNLYGFEYLIAPYTIAHLKLSQFLHDRGYSMRSKERLQIYLTNTLEPITPQPNFLLPALTEEVKNAQEIKDKPILVITGNPPYSGHSKNKGAWISKLIETYKWVDGKPLGEKNPKWLQDDYVKFIRFAQWKMDQVDEGIVGIITNHSFLDNPTFRGMRQSLMQTFNQIYVLDLHGNAKKKERTPDGGKDENVFDIEQGVSISLLVRKKGLAQQVFHADLWGSRKHKYRECFEQDFRGIDWRRLEPNSPYYLFSPQDQEIRAAYEQFWPVTDIFKVNVLGFQTHRDHFAIAFERDDIISRIRDMRDKSKSDAELREKYILKDNRDWQLFTSREKIMGLVNWKDKIIQCDYRPFEKRWCYFGSEVMDYPRRELLDHVMHRDNLCLLIPRQIGGNEWRHALICSAVANDCLVSNRTREANQVFPLYIYSPIQKKPKADLFDDHDPFQGKERIENFSTNFRKFIDAKYGHAYTPEEILGYIYAVLHTPSYRQKYAEFLKIDFPRIPFVDDRAAFERLSALGTGLMEAHLMRRIPAAPAMDITKGSNKVEKPVYDRANQRLYINSGQYFAPVPEDVWEFHIGGYQVLDKYLKSRKDRQLSLDEVENVMNVVKVLRLTIDEMARLETIWRP